MDPRAHRLGSMARSPSTFSTHWKGVTSEFVEQSAEQTLRCRVQEKGSIWTEHKSHLVEPAHVAVVNNEVHIFTAVIGTVWAQRAGWALCQDGSHNGSENEESLVHSTMKVGGIEQHGAAIIAASLALSL